MLIANNFRPDIQPLTDCQINPQPWETAMTAMVTIFGKNS
jgi:hypothetical protein